MAFPFPAFRPTVKKLKKILGPPASTVKKWCHEKSKRITTDPIKKKKKTVKDKKLELPLLQKLLIEVVGKINEIIDSIGLIPELEERIYKLEKALYELGIRHDEEMLTLSDREIAESQRLDAARVVLSDREIASSIRHDKELLELSDRELASTIRHDKERGELSERHDKELDELNERHNKDIHDHLRSSYKFTGNLTKPIHDFNNDPIDQVIPKLHVSEKGGPVKSMKEGGRTQPKPTKRKGTPVTINLEVALNEVDSDENITNIIIPYNINHIINTVKTEYQQIAGKDISKKHLTELTNIIRVSQGFIGAHYDTLHEWAIDNIDIVAPALGIKAKDGHVDQTFLSCGGDCSSTAVGNCDSVCAGILCNSTTGITDTTTGQTLVPAAKTYGLEVRFAV